MDVCHFHHPTAVIMYATRPRPGLMRNGTHTKSLEARATGCPPDSSPLHLPVYHHIHPEPPIPRLKPRYPAIDGPAKCRHRNLHHVLESPHLFDGPKGASCLGAAKAVIAPVRSLVFPFLCRRQVPLTSLLQSTPSLHLKVHSLGSRAPKPLLAKP